MQVLLAMSLHLFPTTEQHAYSRLSLTKTQFLDRAEPFWFRHQPSERLTKPYGAVKAVEQLSTFLMHKGDVGRRTM